MEYNRITRQEFNQLMEIPEAREIYEAKMLELKLVFKDRMENPGEPDPSNLIYMNIDKRGPTTEIKKVSTRIVNTESYLGKGENEQISAFMEYFNNHPVLRRTVLNEFFLRILPFAALEICKDA